MDATSTQNQRGHGISRATFFKWRSKYGGASVSDVTRLRELEAENAELKRMYSDLALGNAAIKDVLATGLPRRASDDTTMTRDGALAVSRSSKAHGRNPASPSR